MLIEIHGGSFLNLGAQQMMHVAILQLAKRIPEARFCVDTTFGTAEDLKSYNLNQLWPARGSMTGRHFRLRFLLQRKLPRINNLQKHKTIVRANDVDALVDVSGFAFTDQWGIKAAKNFFYLAKEFRRRRKKVIMLPQAFGPFELKTNRDYFSQILKSVDLVYARDSSSFNFARDLHDTNDLKIAPDITLFHNSSICKAAESNNLVLIVPNARVLAQGADQWGGKYLSLLGAAATDLQSLGAEVKILVHDRSGEDFVVARELNRALRKPLEILEETEPWAAKNLIGSARLLVGSRYHAAVAAFSNCVPSIALGWAHKYEQLYGEFDMLQHVIFPDQRSRLLILAKSMMELKSNQAMRDSIANSMNLLTDQNRLMWREVTQLLVGR